MNWAVGGADCAVAGADGGKVNWAVGADCAVAGADGGKAHGTIGEERSVEQKGVAQRTEASKSNDASARRGGAMCQSKTSQVWFEGTLKGIE